MASPLGRFPSWKSQGQWNDSCNRVQDPQPRQEKQGPLTYTFSLCTKKHHPWAQDRFPQVWTGVYLSYCL